MAKVQSVDRKASSLFVDDVNPHHEEWLRFCTTNLHCRAVRDAASSSGCKQGWAGKTFYPVLPSFTNFNPSMANVN